MRARINSFASVVFAILLLIAFGLPMMGRARGQHTSRFFLVSLPELGNQRYGDSMIDIPVGNYSRLQIFIPKPVADQVDYGRIFVSLNGQSANRIIDKVGLPDGKLLTLDLKKLPGFLLRNGKNAIEVIAQL